MLLDAADVGYLFEVGVAFLVAYHREHTAVIISSGILFKYSLSRAEERHIDVGLRFLSMGHYPHLAVEHLLDMFLTEACYIGVGQPGIAGENEQVAHHVETRDRYFLLRYLQHVLLFEIATVNRLLLHFVAEIRVGEGYSHSLGLQDWHTQQLEELVDGVHAAIMLCGEEHLEVNEEDWLQVAESDVGSLVLHVEELHHAAVASLILLVGLLTLLDSDQPLGLFKKLLIYRNKGFLLCRDAEIGIRNHLAGCVSMLLFYLVVMTGKSQLHIIDDTVLIVDFTGSADDTA